VDRTPAVALRLGRRGRARLRSARRPRPSYAPGPGCLGRPPAGLAERRRPAVRRARGLRALARGAPPDVRPCGRRPAAAVLLRRARRAPPPAADRGAGAAQQPVRRRARRAVPDQRALLLPRRTGQRRLARRPDRPRAQRGHHGRDPVAGRGSQADAAAQRRRRRADPRVQPRPRRPARHGRLLPADLGALRAEVVTSVRPADQHPVPPPRRAL
ncbi:MAG: Alkylated DNA repair protein AlkB, partial [uncultured Nocardioidaceae bacterium]